MKSFWDERYAAPEYVYGETPNAFFKAQLEKLSPGRLLLPCEGEGRNAVFAAQMGWEVAAFDQSEMGRDKALRLAERKAVQINYQICDWSEASYPARILRRHCAHFRPLTRCHTSRRPPTIDPLLKTRRDAHFGRI